MRHRLVLLCLLTALIGLRGTASPPPAESLSQPRINAIAASLEHARRAVIEDTGLRQPNEKLAAYLARIARPLPQETTATYRKRIEGYLAALRQAVSVTNSLRQIPSLKEDSPANRQNWQRIVRSLHYLPIRLARLQSAWRDRPELHSPAAARFLSELRETLHLVITAFDGLRDASP